MEWGVVEWVGGGGCLLGHKVSICLGRSCGSFTVEGMTRGQEVVPAEGRVVEQAVQGELAPSLPHPVVCAAVYLAM